MKVEALALGFKHVESAPLVRSSYHARDQVPGAEARARHGARPPSTPRAGSSRSPADRRGSVRPRRGRRSDPRSSRRPRTPRCARGRPPGRPVPSAAASDRNRYGRRPIRAWMSFFSSRCATFTAGPSSSMCVPTVWRTAWPRWSTILRSRSTTTEQAWQTWSSFGRASARRVDEGPIDVLELVDERVAVAVEGVGRGDREDGVALELGDAEFRLDAVHDRIEQRAEQFVAGRDAAAEVDAVGVLDADHEAGVARDVAPAGGTPGRPRILTVSSRSCAGWYPTGRVAARSVRATPCHDRRVSVEFDPDRLDRGRRRFEPAVIGAVVVAIAIVAAIAKPWDAAPTTPQPAASQAAVAATERSPSPTPTPRADDGRPGLDRGHERRHARTTHGASPRSSATGRIAAGRRRDAPRYTELWTPTSTDRERRGHRRRHPRRRRCRGSRHHRPGRGAATGRAVLAAPPEQRARVDQRREDRQPGGDRAPLLVRMPLLDGVASVPWEAGQYRVDVLTGDGIHRISVVIETAVRGRVRPRRLARQSRPTPSRRPRAIRRPSDRPVRDRRWQRGVRSRRASRSRSARSRPGATSPAPATDRGRDLPAARDRARGDADVARRGPGGDDPTSRAREPLSDPPEASGGISEARVGRRTSSSPRRTAASGRRRLRRHRRLDDAAGAHHGTWHVELRPGVG